MKKNLLALLVCFLSAHSPALSQYADLLNNRDITWVAEYISDFSLNPVKYSFRFFEDNDYIPDNELNIIHLNVLPGEGGLYEEQDMERYFTRKIFKSINDGEFELFEDEALELPVAQDEFRSAMTRVDTVATDADNFNGPGYRIVRNDLSYEEIELFKVRQVFYFNNAEKKFGSRVLAIAPMIQKRDLDGNYIETAPLVWLKIAPPPKIKEKASPLDFSYAFETKMNGNAPELQGFLPKKGRMDFLTLIVNEVARPTHRVLDRRFEPIDPANLQAYVLITDTVTTFDPELYEQKTLILPTNAIKDVERIGFVQHWYYDDRKKQFFNRIVALVPLIGVVDEREIKYLKPLFYMMEDN